MSNRAVQIDPRRPWSRGQEPNTSAGTRLGQPAVVDSPGVLAEWRDDLLDAGGDAKHLSRQRSPVRVRPRTRVAQDQDRALPNGCPKLLPRKFGWDAIYGPGASGIPVGSSGSTGVQPSCTHVLSCALRKPKGRAAVLRSALHEMADREANPTAQPSTEDCAVVSDSHDPAVGEQRRKK